MGTQVLLDLNSALFHSKVYGCWLGKNCGGTLGAPLERVLGEPEPFDIWWYPELREGGIPNDDLEIQLVWLKALEEVGPHLRAAHLAQYWLDYICYNFDEYGLHKTNLRLGLRPPVSGAYNNWFKDCMGSPIRSEIWACVTPGVPSLAVRYAYEDAICDHAGGEGVFGEMFNAAIESAAFVTQGRDFLLDIGLSYLPEWSATTRAVHAARKAYAEGLSWQEARQRVLAATPHHVAQYAPINMGFQVIGWLYGEHFGDALCKTVNCGYDTDCTGATLGSILGIIAGRERLPAEWMAPLGEMIATNESWGGLAHLAEEPNPVPTNLGDLTARVCAMAKRVLAAHGWLSEDGNVRVDLAELMAPAAIRTLWEANPLRVEYRQHSVHVGIDYQDTPVGVPETRKSIRTTFSNPHPTPLQARCVLQVPTGWTVASEAQDIHLLPYGNAELTWNIPVPPPALVRNANLLFLSVQPQQRPAEPALPVVLIGASRYRYSGPYALPGLSASELLARPWEPETIADSLLTSDGRAGTWTAAYAFDHALPFGELLARGGVLYVQTFLWSPTSREVWLGAATTCPHKVWVNGELLAEVPTPGPFRPSYFSEVHSGFAQVHLLQGWNEVLFKFVRVEHAPAFIAHVLLSSANRLHHGQPDIERTRLPWEQ